MSCPYSSSTHERCPLAGRVAKNVAPEPAAQLQVPAPLLCPLLPQSHRLWSWGKNGPHITGWL